MLLVLTGIVLLGWAGATIFTGSMGLYLSGLAVFAVLGTLGFLVAIVVPHRP